MRGPADKVPTPLREQPGVRHGEVANPAAVAGLSDEPVASDSPEDRRLTVVPARGVVIDDDLVRALRDAGQR